MMAEEIIIGERIEEDLVEEEEDVIGEEEEIIHHASEDPSTAHQEN